jgi:hypothetical protein
MTTARRQAVAFVDRLAALKFANVFNPYRDTCAVHDLRSAPAIRRRNLETILEAALTLGVDSMWVAQDLGHLGGRRTGLALTDDVHLQQHAELFGVCGVKQATRGPELPEMSARATWQALVGLKQRVFLWNVFPLHPHEERKPLSNRTHTPPEAEACAVHLRWLADILSPRSVIAVGRKAEAALSRLGIEPHGVRHPSRGGQNKFLSDIQHHYRCRF